MKIIKTLSELIEEELEFAETYARLAVEHKEENPSLASTFHEIATQELRHVDMLHGEVVSLIKKHRETHGEPPAPMMAIYEWQHKKEISHTSEVKRLLEMYRT